MADLVVKPENSTDASEYILRVNQTGDVMVDGLTGGLAYRAGVIAWDDTPFTPLPGDTITAQISTLRMINTQIQVSALSGYSELISPASFTSNAGNIVSVVIQSRTVPEDWVSRAADYELHSTEDVRVYVGDDQGAFKAFAVHTGAYFAPIVTAPVSLSPGVAKSGVQQTITFATFSGNPVPSISNTVTLDGVDVTAQVSDGLYTPLDDGLLVVESVAINVVSQTNSIVSVDIGNHGPIAQPVSLTTEQHTALSFDPTSNDSDPDGDPITVQSFTQPSNGSVAAGTGTDLIYTPDVSYLGADSFTYTISDGDGGTDTATVSIEVIEAFSGDYLIEENSAAVAHLIVSPDIPSDQDISFDINGEVFTTTQDQVDAGLPRIARDMAWIEPETYAAGARISGPKPILHLPPGAPLEFFDEVKLDGVEVGLPYEVGDLDALKTLTRRIGLQDGTALAVPSLIIPAFAAPNLINPDITTWGRSNTAPLATADNHTPPNDGTYLMHTFETTVASFSDIRQDVAVESGVDVYVSFVVAEKNTEFARMAFWIKDISQFPAVDIDTSAGVIHPNGTYVDDASITPLTSALGANHHLVQFRLPAIGTTEFRVYLRHVQTAQSNIYAIGEWAIQSININQNGQYYPPSFS